MMTAAYVGVFLKDHLGRVVFWGGTLPCGRADEGILALDG